MFNRERVLLECDTNYEHYQVVEMIYEGRKARILFSGKRDAAFSGMPLDDNHDLLFDYIQRMFEFTANVHPKRLLLIGGGTYTLPTALLQTLPDIHIDAVEIDPQLEVIAREFFNLQDNSRLNIIHTDGKSFLQNTTEMYDLIIIDAFSHLVIPESLADTEFAQLVHSHLTDDGLVAMNVISSFNGRRSDTVRKFYNLYNPVFKRTTVHPASPDVSLWLSQNFILVADKSDTPVDSFMRYKALPALS